MMCKVYAVSGSVSFLVEEFNDSKSALQFCEANDYCLTDENDFVWDLEIEEEE